MNKKFEKPLLEAKDSVKKMQVLLDMLENINMRKLNFIFNEHVEKHSLPVNIFHIEDLHYEFGKLGYRHGEDDPDSSAYMSVIECLYQLVYVTAVYNKEIAAPNDNEETPTTRRLTDGKEKFPSKQNVLTDYELGVLEPELDETGDLTVPITEEKDSEIGDYNLIFTGLGILFCDNGFGTRECLTYKNTYRLYLAMKRLFENRNP